MDIFTVGNRLRSLEKHFQVGMVGAFCFSIA
jgi:hypothetical protein